MTAPTCQAGACAGVPSDDKGLCPAHRRALTLTVEIQDAVRKYVNGAHWQDVVKPTTDNAKNVVEAGELLAQGIALLISTRFDDVTFDPAPIYAQDLSTTTHTPWRVSFSWQAHELKEQSHDDDLDDDEHDDETEMTS